MYDFHVSPCLQGLLFLHLMPLPKGRALRVQNLSLQEDLYTQGEDASWHSHDRSPVAWASGDRSP